MQQENEEEWIVGSISGCNPDGYTVKRVQECSAFSCNSRTMCKEPQCGFLCAHMYSCDKKCYDYNIGHVCKHIHRVHSMFHQESSKRPLSQELDNDFDSISYTESIFDPHIGKQLCKLIILP